MAASLEVGGWRAELEGLLARFGRLFVRAEPRQQAGRYLEGLLAPVERKNGWPLAERRRAAKVPEDVPFLTKPEIARGMIARALDAGVPCGWVLGDEVYGADRRLRAMLEERGRPYVLAIRGNDRLDAELEGGVGRDTPAALTRALPPRAWRRLSAGAGTKGARLYDWARVRLARPREQPSRERR